MNRIEIVEYEAELTYTIPVPQVGVTSEAVPVLDSSQSGPIVLYRSGARALWVTITTLETCPARD